MPPPDAPSSRPKATHSACGSMGNRWLPTGRRQHLSHYEGAVGQNGLQAGTASLPGTPHSSQASGSTERGLPCQQEVCPPTTGSVLTLRSHFPLAKNFCGFEQEPATDTCPGRDPGVGWAILHTRAGSAVRADARESRENSRRELTPSRSNSRMVESLQLDCRQRTLFSNPALGMSNRCCPAR